MQLLLSGRTGLRGGISTALVLPNSSYKEVILASCYCLVLFSIVGQGLTLSRLVTAVSQPRQAEG